MAYTDIDDPTAYFQTALYTGNGGTISVVNDGNSDLQPDLLWFKCRSNATDHSLQDSVRGASLALQSNSTSADADVGSSQITAFNSDGFSLSSGGDVNTNTRTYCCWQWKAGTSFTNDASSTGIGSIDSAGSVNTDAGFSIMTYTGTGSNATFAHGLSAVPKMAIFKDRSSTGYWMTYHQAVGNGANLVLNATDAKSDSAVWWNSTSPTSSVFSIGTSNNINVSGRNYVGYLFADVKGYSKFGSYVGNGNVSGSYIHLGFKPAWVMVKKTSGTGNWMIIDNKRSASGGFNVLGERLKANGSDAGSTADYQDHLSNGFKIRTTASSWNDSGGTYIYMAFAENPFVTSGGVPATAR